ncbi:MAG TPA: hypothetical protein VML57_15005 [Burkholderiales bacterium]|nr:hypothetical protein [Burkholderiales bacterium]
MWNELRPGDEILDAIAAIEVQRQAMAREGQGDAARKLSLASLEELQQREQAALQEHGPSDERLANVEALRVEIERVKGLGAGGGGGGGGQRHGQHRPAPKQPRSSRRDARRPPRNRGRR